MGDTLADSETETPMRSRALIALVVAGTGLIGASRVMAQAIIDEALQDFPVRTGRLEYFNPAKLSKLPNYEALRQRYLGVRLRDLENSLAEIGMKESDIDELAIGWQAAKGSENSEGWEMYGLAAGHFAGVDILKQAATRGLKPVSVGNIEVYCLSLDRGGTCIALLDDELGAFCSLQQLRAMLAAHDGTDQGLSSDIEFTNLVNEARCDAPIWGATRGSAMADWLSSSLPGQESMHLDWSKLFSGATTLSYRISLSEKAHLEVRLGCESPAAAANLRQLLEGLRALQHMAWQSRNQNVPNPLENVELDASGDRIDLKLETEIPTA